MMMPIGDLDRVQARHREIEPEKHLSCLRVRFVPEETAAGHEVVGEIFVILKLLMPIKRMPRSAVASSRAARTARAARVLLREERRYSRRRESPRCAGRGREGLRIEKAIDGVTEKQLTEKDRLGREEDPHPELGGVTLLFDVVDCSPRIWVAVASLISHRVSSEGWVDRIPFAFRPAGFFSEASKK